MKNFGIVTCIVFFYYFISAIILILVANNVGAFTFAIAFEYTFTFLEELNP